MYQITSHGSKTTPRLLAVSESREKLEWYLQQECIKYYGTSGVDGCIYTKNGSPIVSGKPFWRISRSNVLIL